MGNILLSLNQTKDQVQYVCFKRGWGGDELNEVGENHYRRLNVDGVVVHMVLVLVLNSVHRMAFGLVVIIDIWC